MPENKKTPNGRPLKKDCYAYFRDDANWLTVEESAKTHIRAQRLKHTGIFRIVVVGIEPDKWQGVRDQGVSYCMSSLSREWPNGYFTERPSVKCAEDAVSKQWREEE